MNIHGFVLCADGIDIPALQLIHMDQRLFQGSDDIRDVNSVAHNLPQYIEAQKVRNTVETNDDILGYTTYLETFGPKLAHYFGYLLGDELLARIVPGYQPDPLLTIRYRDWVRTYMGIEA